MHSRLNYKRKMQNSTLNNDLLNSIEKIIDERLNELTPLMVKEIVQKLIKEHLDWLVVWRGVSGGVIGLSTISLTTYKTLRIYVATK